MLACALVLTLAMPVLANAAPASAGDGACPATCVAGRYELHYKWTLLDGNWHVTDMVLAADGTGSFSSGALPFTWSKWHGKFTMKFNRPGIVRGAYVGFRNLHGGFCNAQRPGTMTNNEGNYGVWYARATT